MQPGHDLQLEVIPDVILSFQWHPKRPIDGERRLCLAILEEAMQCLALKATVACNNLTYARATPEQRTRMKPRKRSYDRMPARNRLAQEAEDWIKSNDDRVFSFRFVCAALELNPEWFRRKLKERGGYDPKAGG